MAALFESSSSAQGGGANNITGASFTIAGSNRFLIINASGSAGTVAAATAIRIGGFGGTLCSLDAGNGTYGSNGHISIGTLVAPPTGSQAPYALWAATKDEVGISAVNCQDVNQSTPKGTVFSASGTGSATSATATVNVTDSSAGDLVVDCVATYHNAGDSCTLVAGADQTSREEEESIGGGFTATGQSEETATGSSTTMSWAITYGTLQTYNWAIRAFKLNGIAAAAVVDGIERIDKRPRPGRGPYSLGQFFRPRLDAYNYVPQNITGTGAITLGAITVSATASVVRTGTGAITLGPMTIAATAAVSRTGTGAITLGAMTVAGTGERSIVGTGAITLGAFTVAGSGSGNVTGTGSITLGALAVAGAGVRAATGTGAITLGAMLVSGSSPTSHTGTGAITLGAMTVFGVGDTPQGTGDDTPYDPRLLRMSLRKKKAQQPAAVVSDIVPTIAEPVRQATTPEPVPRVEVLAEAFKPIEQATRDTLTDEIAKEFRKQEQDFMTVAARFFFE